MADAQQTIEARCQWLGCVKPWVCIVYSEDQKESEKFCYQHKKAAELNLQTFGKLHAPSKKGNHRPTLSRSHTEKRPVQESVQNWEAEAAKKADQSATPIPEKKRQLISDIVVPKRGKK